MVDGARSDAGGATGKTLVDTASGAAGAHTSSVGNTDGALPRVDESKATIKVKSDKLIDIIG